MTVSLETNNRQWGFYGVIAFHTNADAAWREAFVQIAMETGASAEAVRRFLDHGLAGRQFADDVADGLTQDQTLATAVAASIARWRIWTISERTFKTLGIPAGMPYLHGWVSFFATKERVA